MEASHAPDGWFKGTEGLVEKVLISVGQFEPLRNSIVALYNKHFRGSEWDVKGQGELKVNDVIKPNAHHVHLESRVTYIYQPFGNHNDPYYDFFWGPEPKEFGPLTPKVVEWMEGVMKTVA